MIDFMPSHAIAEIIDTSTALSGFSNEGMITVGALFAVVKGVENR